MSGYSCSSCAAHMQVAQGGIDLWEHANRPCNDNGRGGCRGEISQKSSQICPRSRKGARRPSRRLVKADPRLDQEKAAEVDTGERAPKKADETLTKAAEEALEATKAANFKAESEALENRRRLKQRRLMQRPLRQRQKPPPKRPKRRLRQRQSCQREGRAGSFSESGPREGCH